MDVEHPKLFIEVQDAAGRTAEQAADEVAAQFEGMNIERTFGLTVGYEPAMALEKVPGQEISRQVVVAHNDRLYKLTFIPADESLGDIYTQMEELYTMVINSFRFLPPRKIRSPEGRGSGSWSAQSFRLRREAGAGSNGRRCFYS